MNEPVKTHHRIRTIYAKELVDILRDRRTLIAMIVVPIVLYPLLMLGSIQAVSFQAESMKREKLVVGTVNEQQAHLLRDLIDRDEAALAKEQERVDPETGKARKRPQPLADRVTVIWLQSRAELEKAIRDREVQAGVVLADDNLVDAADRQNVAEILADQQAVRGRFLAGKLEGLFRRLSQRTVDLRKKRAGLPEFFDQPFAVTSVNLSTPPSILGQIVPLILILMTITGAIYPAIDLTAGERERGTLESLMVCPVPVIHLIVGKFLVVATVAIMGATLNLTSVTATVYFGGFDKIIASSGGALPVGKMLFILLCLVPFAVLMSAIMLAVCSCARTFKEAQNYVTPVILAVLIPGGIAALPATKLEGVMLVMPVGNMVLLARDLLLGAVVPAGDIVMVLLSTSLYAGAAVAVAANIFGKESVVFSDAGSLRGTLNRALMKPSTKPPVSMGLLMIALLFPAWFFIQSALSPQGDEDAGRLLHATGLLMPILFVIVPAGLLLYAKVSLTTTFSIRRPSLTCLVGGLLIGLSAWIPAHEINVLQQSLVALPQSVVDSGKLLEKTLTAWPIEKALLFIALIPALCEELLFRGLLLSSLGSSARKWTAIVSSAAVFGVFHFLLWKFAITTALGVVLAYVCWQSRSIVPAILIHFLHNTVGVLFALHPDRFHWLGIAQESQPAHLPITVLLVGGFVFFLGLRMCGGFRTKLSRGLEPARIPRFR